MYGDGVGQHGKQVHFFQFGLYQNKAMKSPYYIFGPCCLDVYVENLWPTKISFLLSYLWLEWTPIAI